MTDNIREYHTLKFFRGRRRNNSEMQRLADAELDFDYRRLLIVENELDLYIYFSRMIIYNWFSWGFLALALSYFHLPFIASVFFGLAVLTRVFSYRCKKRFQFVFRSYILALAIVDCVILQDYGIIFR